MKEEEWVVSMCEDNSMEEVFFIHHDRPTSLHSTSNGHFTHLNQNGGEPGVCLLTQSTTSCKLVWLQQKTPVCAQCSAFCIIQTPVSISKNYELPGLFWHHPAASSAFLHCSE